MDAIIILRTIYVLKIRSKTHFFSFHFFTVSIKVEIFLTSEHKIIANRQLAIDHMVKEEYNGEEIAKMQNGLKR